MGFTEHPWELNLKFFLERNEVVVCRNLLASKTRKRFLSLGILSYK